jgi:hypothetical protein
MKSYYFIGPIVVIVTFALLAIGMIGQKPEPVAYTGSDISASLLTVIVVIGICYLAGYFDGKENSE